MLVKQFALITSAFLAVNLYTAVGIHVHYRNCSSAKPFLADVAYVDVSCPKEPCILRKGTTVSCSIAFIPKKDISRGKLEIYGVLSHFAVPFLKMDACQGHNVHCPMKAGVQSLLKVKMEVKKVYPSLQVLVQLDLRNQLNELVFCVQFPARISQSAFQPQDYHLSDIQMEQ
ncbi:ecdysteroid-regulated 16 kDa protein-like [Montipora capricornis]|uniref:ecdysteroid-regulated 16 kDa protein-like n=1 Tax=Montipora foliosa TaxID=591990 RepID=UPI0035F1D29F